VSFAVGSAGWKQFVQADINHDAGHGAEDRADKVSRNNGTPTSRQHQKSGISSEGADRFGQTAQCGVDEGFATAACRVIDRHGNTHALGNIVQGNSHGDGHTEPRILEGDEKSGQALGKIVDPDGQGGEETHAHKFVVMSVRCGLVLRMEQRFSLLVGARLVRILLRGNQIVDQADDENTREKGRRIEPRRHDVAVTRPGQRRLALGKNLHKGNVEHDASGKSGGDGEKTVVGPLGQKSDTTTHHRAQTGEQRQHEGRQQVLVRHSVLRELSPCDTEVNARPSR
jgi:hypothetical protein